MLKELSKVHDLPALVIRYRELAKIKSTYIDALPRLRAGDGFLHTRFNETVTTTGRLSSSDPNLQNIPVRTEFGRRIRVFHAAARGFGVSFGGLLSDRAALARPPSGDEHLVAAFNSGADFHASTAARVFGVPIERGHARASQPCQGRQLRHRLRSAGVRALAEPRYTPSARRAI